MDTLKSAQKINSEQEIKFVPVTGGTYTVRKETVYPPTGNEQKEQAGQAELEVLKGQRQTGCMPDGTPIYESFDYAYFRAQDFDNNGNNAYFFRASSDFLTKLAGQYAQGQSTPNAPGNQYWLEEDAFIRSVTDWFTGNKATDRDYRETYDSVNQILSELVAQQKNSGHMDLSQLTNKLRIGGEAISVIQLKGIQQTSSALVQGTHDFNFGSSSVEEFAEKGIRNAMAGQYANSIPGKLGEGYRQSFRNLMECSAQSDLEIYNNSPKEQNCLSCVLDKQCSPEVYRIFSSLDTSSKENMIADFKNKMNQFDSLLKNQYRHGLYASSYEHSCNR